ncbi:hypothetical protein M405DRAFT_869377 [Rhizopogon salebrosus TDB-379]|nr:hypothetical protein M405DRAFT_869377 [Rhizopogon salebrosus TDB-379]
MIVICLILSSGIGFCGAVAMEMAAHSLDLDVGGANNTDAAALPIPTNASTTSTTRPSTVQPTARHLSAADTSVNCISAYSTVPTTITAFRTNSTGYTLPHLKTVYGCVRRALGPRLK